MTLNILYSPFRINVDNVVNLAYKNKLHYDTIYSLSDKILTIFSNIDLF